MVMRSLAEQFYFMHVFTSHTMILQNLGYALPGLILLFPLSHLI